MKLAHHLQQGELQYLLTSPVKLSVYQNSYYRWLMFGNTIQSIMVKRKPWYLPMTHQYYLLLPLFFLTPKSVVEFGLGGGNTIRFIAHLFPECKLLSIESSKDVGDIFSRYFNPLNATFTSNINTVNGWLSQQEQLNHQWYIWDIYQEEEDENVEFATLQLLLNKLPLSSWLSINVTMSSERAFEWLKDALAQHLPHHQIKWFNVPKYKNKVIHIIPNSSPPITCGSFPIKPWFYRGLKLWRTAAEKRRN